MPIRIYKTVEGVELCVHLITLVLHVAMVHALEPARLDISTVTITYRLMDVRLIRTMTPTTAEVVAALVPPITSTHCALLDPVTPVFVYPDLLIATVTRERMDVKLPQGQMFSTVEVVVSLVPQITSTDNVPLETVTLGLALLGLLIVIVTNSLMVAKLALLVTSSVVEVVELLVLLITSLDPALLEVAMLELA